MLADKISRAWDWLWEINEEGWDIGTLKHSGPIFFGALLVIFGLAVGIAMLVAYATGTR